MLPSVVNQIPRDLAEFYPGAYRRLVGTLCMLGVPREDAREIAQETFVRLIPRWDRVSVYDNPNAWLRMVGWRLWVKRRNKGVAEVVVTRDLVDTGTSVDQDSHMAVRHALEELPKGQREVVVLYYYCDLTVDDVARELAVAPGTVKSRLSRARSALASSTHLEGMQP